MVAPSDRLSARIVARRLRSDLRNTAGELRQWASGAGRGPDAVLLVIGCQRSGTTLMTRIFLRDSAAKVYPEHSILSAGDREHGLRLAHPDLVAQKVSRSRFPLVVMKPLVETQNAPALLSAIPEARALWMFRSWSDVARSNLARFGKQNGIRNLRRVAERRPDDWRSEGVSDEVHARVAQHFSADMNPWDAAALFWWVRNALYFERGLDADSRVRTCRYEELVEEPERVVRGIYRLVGRPLPEGAHFEEVSRTSVGRGSEIFFSPEISEICDTMLKRLCEAHRKGSACA